MQLKEVFCMSDRVVIMLLAFVLSFLFTLTSLLSPSLAASVSLAWDPNDQIPEGYCVYQRKAGKSYNYNQPCWTGSTTNATVSNLSSDTTYYFVVRAYEGELQSANSEEVTYTTPPYPNNNRIIIDDGAAGTSSSGTWSQAGAPNAYGTKSLYSKTINGKYRYKSDLTGQHDVEIWWTEYQNRCSAVPVKILDGWQLLETVWVDQQANGGRWNFLGTYEFTGQARVVIVSNSDTCRTSADAVAFTKADQNPIIIDDGAAGTSSDGTWSKSSGLNPYGGRSLYSRTVYGKYRYQPNLTGQYEVDIWWTRYSSRCSAVPVKIFDGGELLETVLVDQRVDGGRWNFLGIYEFTGQARVVIVSKSDACSTSTDAVRFTGH
jgi:hypothetical protein